MDNTVVQQIRNRIVHSKFGTMFFVSSFPDFDEEYVTKLLSIFEKQGILSRISKGVYIKVKMTRFGPAYPAISEIITKIAKRDHATVIPTGDTAVNKLGFSTQVPMNPIYLTSGSSRKLRLGNRTVTLKHASPRNFAYRGILLPLLVQALSTIGKDNIEPHILKRVRELLGSNPEPKTFVHDIAIAPAWIRNIIKNAKAKNNEQMD